MVSVTLMQIFENKYAKKYIKRAGLDHLINTAYFAFELAKERNVDVGEAAVAAFLHDIGHYNWYNHGEWDFELYKRNDIHAIKGAERAHKLLIILGENPEVAKEISIAILLHTDSYIPNSLINRTELQKIIKLADEMDEEENGKHHYRKITEEEAIEKLKKLDIKIKELKKSS